MTTEAIASPTTTRIGQALDRLRERRPLVQNITNYVSMDIAANALLALGASPAMVHAPEEIDDFGRLIQALAINIGTLSSDWVAAMMLAATVAHERGTPWVLDPVGAGATRFRDASVQQLLPLGPSVIRGNASEIMAVAASCGLGLSAARPKGVDSANTTSEAEVLSIELARHVGCVVVATGAIDFITDGRRQAHLANGSPLMTQVTAIGCSLSAITAAFCAIEPDRFDAAVAALAVVGIAGERAAAQTARPGSFRTAWIDQLATLDATAITSDLKLS
ncbi:hydroxyethylthiazole kinase [Lichenihabitans sp. PAMC28606]|uniref:hydroxyethylthiazole kinase n=1 Tax=Lichenihabitans sp. PAMC28606 TaxID=2880932 RepID=UPI001D0B3509|nr:hydroxyethylthiazole kinase [Lichenihabitans sp. PAMC28606]UDL95074.1 hydroxyethylthiazole kinase [Lichenihabitans sp. PAMC28606]